MRKYEEDGVVTTDALVLSKARPICGFRWSFASLALFSQPSPIMAWTLSVPFDTQAAVAQDSVITGSLAGLVLASPLEVWPLYCPWVRPPLSSTLNGCPLAV